MGDVSVLGILVFAIALPAVIGLAINAWMLNE
jgi:hypothetical protein